MGEDLGFGKSDYGVRGFEESGASGGGWFVWLERVMKGRNLGDVVWEGIGSRSILGFVVFNRVF